MTIRNRYSGVVHGFGECHNCGATFDNYKNALALSAQHAKKYDHHVTCEQAISVSYNDPRGDK